MLTNGHITLVNGCIKAKMDALIIRWMYKMNVYIKNVNLLTIKGNMAYFRANITNWSF